MVFVCFQASNIKEVGLIKDPLLNLKSAVLKLLEEFPENSVLLKVLKIVDRSFLPQNNIHYTPHSHTCYRIPTDSYQVPNYSELITFFRILSFPIETGIYKVLIGLELLIDKAQLWEQNAPQRYSIKSTFVQRDNNF